METLNLAQVIVTAIAVMLMGTPLLVLSFLAGRRSSVKGRSYRLDQLRSDATLGGSCWCVEFDGDADPGTVESIVIDLEQVGCRIVGSSRSTEGNRQTLEGFLHLGRLCCVSIDENRDGTWLGTITAELLPGEQQMTGMRTRWSPQSQTLSIRRATFTRLVS